MCRVMGAVFRGAFPIASLKDLKHVSATGKIPDEPKPGHRDGWGIVSFRDSIPFYIRRSALPAFKDPAFNSALKEIPELEPPNILIAHVRALSQGVASIANTHPFIMENMVLAHNGTMTDFRPKTHHKPKGETDSELLMALLADRMEEMRDMRQAVVSLIKEDISKNKFSAAILLISDGRKLYGYRDYAPERSPEYYDLRIARCEQCVVLFQESRMSYDCELPRIRKGELVIIDLGLNVEREMLH
jgi:predicted glutamine amidotransferase